MKNVPLFSIWKTQNVKKKFASSNSDLFHRQNSKSKTGLCENDKYQKFMNNS